MFMNGQITKQFNIPEITESALIRELSKLPRPVYGHIDSQTNMILPRKHRHHWGQLSYTLRGYLQVWTQQAYYIALPQRAVWIPPGVLHEVKNRTSRTILRSLYIDLPMLGDNWQECKVLAVTPLLHELIRSFSLLPVEYNENGPDGRLAQVLIDQIRTSKSAGLILPWPDDKRLQPICKELQDNPDADVDLTHFSKKIGVSEKTLTRIFQKETGLGFRLWRQRARLVHALPLLERGDRITDVAIACGYESLSSFISTFRQHTGVTPGEFASKQADESEPI